MCVLCRVVKFEDPSLLTKEFIDISQVHEGMGPEEEEIMIWTKFKDKLPKIHEDILFITLTNLIPRLGYLHKSMADVIFMCACDKRDHTCSTLDLYAWITVENFMEISHIRDIVFNKSEK